MREGNLYGFGVDALGEIDGLPNGLPRLAGKPDNEIAMNGQAQLFAILGEPQRHVDGGAFLDVFQDLLVSRFITHDQ